ncbi:hypothetical protein ACEQPO_15775 [Bacillus sp. SL00103]
MYQSIRSQMSLCGKYHEEPHYKDHVMTVLKEETVRISNKNIQNKTDLKEIPPVQKEKNNQK